MANLLVNISTAKSAPTLVRDYQRSTSAKYPNCQAIADLITSILAGNQSQPSIEVSVQQDETKAHGTFTLTSVIATNAVSINGVSFTAVASGAGANQFNVGVDDDHTATNLANAINASVSALVTGYVTAAKTSSGASPAVVTVTSAFPGTAGNQTTIASAAGTIVASAARLASGAVDAGSVTYTF